MDNAPRFRGEKINIFETTTYSSLVDFCTWKDFRAGILSMFRDIWEGEQFEVICMRIHIWCTENIQCNIDKTYESWQILLWHIQLHLVDFAGNWYRIPRFHGSQMVGRDEWSHQKTASFFTTTARCSNHPLILFMKPCLVPRGRSSKTNLFGHYVEPMILVGTSCWWSPEPS